MRNAVALICVLLFTGACTDAKSATNTLRSRAELSVTPGGTLTGTVREQIPVGPYVYLRLETPSGETWAAVNEAPVTTGSSVTVYNVMAMEQFNSPTLKRTFARIYFGTLDSAFAATAAAAASGAASTGSATDSSLIPTAASGNAPVGPIAKASGADGRSISELWSQKEHLAGATISVRGVVVKYNASVMGKNWIHLQDGTGDAAKGTNDLTVTSQDASVVGDTVTVTGTLRTNQDLGAGYTYAVLLENAKVARR